MKRYSLSIFLLLLAVFCQAQSTSNDRYTDSIQHIMNSPANDSIKAASAFHLSEYWVLKDTARAHKYLEQGYRYAKENNYLHAAYQYYKGFFLAKTYPEQGQSVLLKADTLLSRFPTKDAYRLRARVWHNYGVIRQHQDDHKVFADIILNKAIPMAKMAGDSAYIARNYLNLCIVFKNHQDFAKAAEYCRMAIQGFTRANADPEMIITAYYTAAENYSLWMKPRDASPLLDSAKAWLDRYPDVNEWIPYYKAEGMHYTVQFRYPEALHSLEKGLELARKKGDRYEEQSIIMQQFYVYYNQKDYNKALKAFQFLLQQPEIMTLQHNRLQLYYGMAETYVAMNRPGPAYEWLKRYSQLNDTIYESRLKTDINALEVKYNAAENKRQITALESEKKEAALKAKNTRLTIGLLIVVIVALLISSILAIVFYRSNKKLSAQKEINYQQQLREMTQQQQLIATRAMLDGEERERSRLSRDLHDGLGGMLSGIKMKLARQVADMQHLPAVHTLDDTIIQLDHSVDELRRIARNLMPESLLKFGLETAINDLCEGLSSQHTQIDFQYLVDQPVMPLVAQLNIYRIIQELLTNAIRHSAATSILLQCSRNGRQFFITVEDNGKGFDSTHAHSKPGIGLTSLHHRVDYLQGKIQINSTPNTGTTADVELLIPAE
ncbi:sensor histidine kinase [Chitinophaga pendula]|uniref:tetratricopeptide repeat-containing sensor histidine kinase n=1 Tax=Chitinophaga TaxID=79328 RepID=UPI0018E06253|nr:MULTISPECIES: sensor histidine kinase [Chitinophaga]UCJ09717.1 sensor histidine kinase [Chitinophaga pendula]